MLIHNASIQNVFRSNYQMQNVQFRDIVNKLNANAQQNRRNFDTAEISMKARQLENAENVSQDKLIDYQNSPLNGNRTEAEWAESSLTQQRNGVSSVKNTLDYQKERLKNTVSQIEKYQKIANGDFSNESSCGITQERASELVERYGESIKTDFSKEIEDTIAFYNQWVKTYDKYSNGLASEVMGNTLQVISVDSLGLNNLSNDPIEIMKALDKATEKLQNMAKIIEGKFYQASGKNMSDLNSPNMDMWKNRIEMENAFIESVTVDKNTILTGETLKSG